jgi:hypothetical protein
VLKKGKTVSSYLESGAELAPENKLFQQNDKVVEIFLKYYVIPLGAEEFY